MMTPNSISELIQSAREHLDRLYRQIDPVKSCAEQALKNIEVAKQPLRQVLYGADMLQTRLTETERVVREEQAELTKMEDAVAVLQRALFHIHEHAERQKSADYDPIIREVSSLLHLSLRLAIQMFPPDQLMTLAQTRSGYSMDMLRKRWQAWLADLTNYLKEVIPLVSYALDTGERGILSDEYKYTLEELSQKTTQLVERLKRETTFQMARLSGGPLGNVQLLGKIKKPSSGDGI